MEPWEMAHQLHRWGRPAGLCSWKPGQRLGLCLLCITLPEPRARCWPCRGARGGGSPQCARQPRGSAEQFLAVSRANLHFFGSHQPTLTSLAFDFFPGCQILEVAEAENLQTLLKGKAFNKTLNRCIFCVALEMLPVFPVVNKRGWASKFCGACHMPYPLLTPDFTNTTSRQAEYLSRPIVLLNREVIHVFQLSAGELRELFGGDLGSYSGVALVCSPTAWQ